MQSEPVTVYLSLGSNMGDRKKNLDRALDALSQRMRLGKISSVYDTEAVGENAGQARFLNLVCQAYTTLAPSDLLVLAKGIEVKGGRALGKPNAPRPIDIDILLYGDQVIDTRDLVIPHPRMAGRAFVLIPLVEIAPDVVHPATKKTARKMLEGLKKGVQGVFKWEEG